MIWFLAAGLVAAFLPSANAGADYKKIFVKFGITDGFYEIPTTLEKLKKDKDYKFVKHDNHLNVDMYSFHQNPQFLILFDKCGNIAGIRTGYKKDEIPKRGLSKGKHFSDDWFTKKPGFQSDTIWGHPVWTATALFTSPDKLKAGGRSDTGGLVLEDLYLNITGKFSKIDKDECQAEKSGFYKQACFVGMGMHYFYNMTPSLDCELFNGHFLLFEGEELIGIGLIPFGSFATEKRTWFEDPTVTAVKAICPNRPDCLTEYIENFGSSSLHVYFKAHPRFTFCTSPWQKEDQCK